VSFDPRLNLLTGENDVGKSTLIKSLYHALGADVPQLQNTRWKRARPIYCVKFSIGGNEYSIIRDERYFGVFDAERKLIGRYSGIGGERGVGRFTNALLGFRIELERAADSGLSPAGPAFYFLPFYVDQDAGWTKSWASFNGLPQFKDYRRSMIEYHLGVRPQSYYDARKREIEFNEQLGEKTREKNALIAVRDSYRKRKIARQVDIDPSVFKKEIEELLDGFNEIYGRQQQVLHELKEARSEQYSIDNEIAILRHAIRELDADYTLAESPEMPDPIPCPTCGSEIQNSIAERFGILDDIDYCNSLIDQRTKKRMEIQYQIEEIEERYRQISDELNRVEELLQRTRQNITFAELVSSEGIKELLQSIDEDVAGLSDHENDIRRSIASLAPDLKLDGSRKKMIVEYYQQRMKEFLDMLNVHVLEGNDYKTLDRQIKNNALGSDLPRSLLAQYMAFLHTMNAYNDFVVCPLVIDSPLQQEQDNSNVDAIFGFMFSRSLPAQQLIVGTLSVEHLVPGVLPVGAKECRLGDKYHLLEKSEYTEVINDIGSLHEETLASER
jgi:hypothetical protein